jgi:hypothetical protein
MFDFWNNMSKMERVTKDKLKEVVEKGFITEEEYELITKEKYSK